MKKSFTHLISWPRVSRQSLISLLTLHLLLALLLIGKQVNAQSITSISPQCVTAGQSFTLTIAGSDFSSSGANSAKIILDADNTNLITPLTIVSGSNGQITATIPGNRINDIGSHTIQIRQTSGNTVQLSNVVTFNVNRTPTVSNSTVTRCGTGSVILSASGAPEGNYKWYTVAEGGTAIPNATNSTYSPTVSSNTTYYVAMAFGNCESSRAAISVIVNSVPDAPATASNSRCGTGTLQLSASGAPSGGGYRWYTMQTEGTAISGATGAVFTTPSLSATTTYYVSTVSAAGCESATRTPVTATINAIPAAPGVTPGERCGPGPVTLTASGAPNGGSYRWYTTASGGTAIANATGATYITPSLSTTTPYYVSIVSAAGCEGPRATVTATINTIPTVAVQPSEQPDNNGIIMLCENSVTIVANAMPAGGNYTYQWYNGATPIAQATSPVFTTEATGNYYVVVTNKQGDCSSSPSTTIKVQANSKPAAPIVPAVSRCGAGSVTLAVSDPQQNVTYRWYNASNALVNTGPTYVITNLTATATFSVSATNAAGCISSSRTNVTATIYTKPIATVTSSVTPVSGVVSVCSGNTVTLTAAAQPTGSYSYQWFKNGIAISTGTNATYSTTESGVYHVVVTNPNGNCPSDPSSPITIQVNPLPEAPITTSNARCGSGTIDLAASGAPSGGSYRWYTTSSGGTPIAGQTDGTYSPSLSANTTYYVSTVSSAGCESTTRTPVTATINTVPKVTVSAATATEFCNGGGVVLNASVTPVTPVNGGSYTYQWYEQSSGLIAGATQSSFTANETGTYYLIVTNTSGDCPSANSNSIAVTVNPIPAVPVVNNTFERCGSGTVTLTATAGANGNTLRWYSTATSGTVLAEALTYTTPVLNADTEYYVATYNTTTKCEGERVAVNVTVKELPDVTITPTGPTGFCVGNSVLLVAKEDPAYTYQWFKNGTAVPGAEANTYEVDEVGVHNIHVEITKAGCTLSSEVIAVRVSPNPDNAAISIVGATTFCEKGSVQLTAPAGTGYTYAWEVKDGNSFIPAVAKEGTPNNTRIFIADKSGIYRVIVTKTTDEISCSKMSDEVSVTVLPQPTASIATPTIVQQCDQREGSTTYTVVGTYSNGTGVWSTSDSRFSISDKTETTDANGITTSTITVTAPANVTSELTTTIRLDVTQNQASCEPKSASVSLTVWPLPVVTVSVSGPTTFCAGGSVTLTATGGASYLWSNGATGPSITVTTSGSYSVTATSNRGCKTTSAPVAVTVNPMPDATITASGDLTFCQGGSVTLSAPAAPAGSTYAYQWLNGTTEITTDGNGQTYIAKTSGDYKVRVTDTSKATNCSVTTTTATVVKVNTTPTASISANGASTTFCQGGSVTLTATATPSSPVAPGAYSYQWYNANGSINGADKATFSATESGNYYVIITNSAGTCSSAKSNSITVTVNTRPVATITALGETTFCRGGTVTLRADATPGSPVGGGSYTYQWYNSSGPIAGQTSQTYTANTTGNYSVVITNTNGSCASARSAATAVTVNELPVLSIAQPAQGAYCISQAPITLSASPGGGSFTIDGNSATVFNPAALGVGTHTIVYTYTNTNGCTNTVSKAVVVNPLPNVSIVGLSSTYCASAGSVNLVGSPSGGTFRILNSTGGAIGTNPTTFNPSSLGPGNYTVEYTYADANSCTNKATQAVTIYGVPVVNAGASQTACQTLVNNNPGATTFNLSGTASVGGPSPGLAVQWSVAEKPGTVTNVSFSNAASLTSTVSITGYGTVKLRLTATSNGCSTYSDVSVTVTQAPAKPVVSGLKANYFTGEGSVTMSVTPSNLQGTFEIRNSSGAVVSTGSSFSPCTLGAGSYTATFSYAAGTCSRTSDPVAFTITRSKYTVIVTADPFPICRGQNTAYTIRVYRDLASVVYPYKVDSQGRPLKDNNTVAGDTEMPAINPDYFAAKGIDPTSLPTIVRNNIYRFYEPIVTLGTNGVLINSADINNNTAGQFNYIWTRNKSVPGSGIGPNQPTHNQSGLSATDWFGGMITSGSLSICGDIINSLSNRMYLSEPDGYTVSLGTVGSWCYTANDQTPVTLTATLGTLPGGWASTDLELNWIIVRNSTRIPIGTSTYTGSSTITIQRPRSLFQNGDKVIVEFYTDYSDYIGLNSKCLPNSTSNEITIRIDQPAAITANLSAIPAQCESSSVTISVTATGTNLQYEWYKVGSGTPLVNSSKISGANTNAITISNLALSDAGNYYVVVRNGGTSPCSVPATSNQVQLTINPKTVVTTSPVSQTVCAGTGVTFTAGATGTGVTYQWYKGTQVTEGAKISGATNGSYAITNVTVDDAGSYTVAMTGTCGTETRTVQLVVNTPPQASPAITAGTYCEGDQAIMSINATGTNLKYEWYRNDTLIANTSNSLTLAQSGPKDSGLYTVKVTGTCSTEPVVVTLGTLTIRKKINAPTGTITAMHKSDPPRPITPEDPVKLGETAVFTAVNDFEKNGDAISYVWYVGSDATGQWTVVPNVTGNVYERVAENDDPYQVKVEILGRNGNKCYAYLSIKLVTENPITPLPVELTYFKAVRSGTAVVLTWETASEKDNKGFEVQVSQDGKSYRQLQFVPSKNGTSSLKQKYEFVDKENGKHGTRHYRLRQLDLDGKYTYYGPVAVAFGEAVNKVLVYPNPFEREVKLEVDAEKSTTMEVTLTNIMGRQLLLKHINVEQGKNTTTLDLGADLPAGVYIITTRYNGTTNSFKLFKQ